MAWGLSSDDERLRRFAEQLRAEGHAKLANGLLNALKWDRRYAGESGNKASVKTWMETHMVDGATVLSRWKRQLIRERQAKFRDGRRLSNATISVDRRIKQKLARLKQPDESWSDLLLRLSQGHSAGAARKS